MLGEALLVMVIHLFLNESVSRTRKIIYKMEDTEKNFHIDVLGMLTASFYLLCFAVVFATSSWFLIEVIGRNSTIFVLLPVGVASLANQCLLSSSLDGLKLNYLDRVQNEETKEQETN